MTFFVAHSKSLESTLELAARHTHFIRCNCWWDFLFVMCSPVIQGEIIHMYKASPYQNQNYQQISNRIWSFTFHKHCISWAYINIWLNESAYTQTEEKQNSSCLALYFTSDKIHNTLNELWKCYYCQNLEKWSLFFSNAFRVSLNGKEKAQKCQTISSVLLWSEKKKRSWIVMFSHKFQETNVWVQSPICK